MTMNHNVSPYFDDFDETKNFHKILFKPGVACQAREFSQIQSILKNQTAKFANHIFQDGSVVSGGEHFYDFVTYFKIKTNTSLPVDITSLVDMTFKTSDNRSFLIKHATPVSGADYVTIFAILVSGGDTKFSDVDLDPNSTIRIYTKTDVLLYTAETAEVPGKSVLFHINEGVFYTKNTFVYCPPQTTVVKKYDTFLNGSISFTKGGTVVTGIETTFLTDVKVGDDIFTSKYVGTVASIESNVSLTLEKIIQLDTATNNFYKIGVSAVIGLTPVESIVTSDEDPSLLDPSFGSNNFAAPGADRYMISLKLETKSYQDKLLSSQDFIDLSHISNGVVTVDNRKPIYSNIAEEFARRTYDESGNYIVEGLLPTIYDDADENKLQLSISAGKAYIKGYEVDKNRTSFIELDKSREFSTENDHIISSQYGNYIEVSLITPGFLPTANKRTELTFFDSASRIIGTAICIGVDYSTLGVFKLFLDDVDTKGYKFKDVSDITWTNASNVTSHLKPVSETIKDTNKQLLVFQVPNITVKSINNLRYTSKITYNSANVYNGVCTLSSGSAYKDFDASTGSSINEHYIINVLTSSNETNFPVGSIIDASNSTLTVNNPIGSSSTAELNFNDSSFNGTVSVTTTIYNSGNASRTKILRKDYGIAFEYSSSALNNSIGVSDVNRVVGVYLYSGDPITRDSLTYIDGYNYPSNSIVIKDNKAYYITGTTLGVELTDVSYKYSIDKGQTNSSYLHATIKKIKDANVSENILIVVDYFEHSGDGPIYVNSYDVAVPYPSLPKYTDGYGIEYKLRNCIDFRPVQRKDSLEFDTFTLPLSNQVITVNVDYYLQRIDKLVLDKNGTFTLLKGQPSYDSPITPSSGKDVMDICSFTFEPFTDNSSNVKTLLYKNKRYTMRDIGTLDKRLENVEYYTSLSLLEKETSTKTFTDDNGVPLFNNGFLVDSFKGYNIADVTNPEVLIGAPSNDNSNFKFSIDFENNELRPGFLLDTGGLSPSNNPITTSVHENTITLPYTERVLYSQMMASTAVSANPYSVYNSKGNAVLTPDSDYTVFQEEAIDTNTARQLLIGNENTERTKVTIFGSWKPGGETADITTGITDTQDFLELNSQKNQVVQGQTYNVVKLIQGTTRENVVKVKLTGMLPNVKIYYFFEGEIQEKGWQVAGQKSSAEQFTDSKGSYEGYIYIPAMFLGSKFNVTFTDTPAGIQYSSSTAETTYNIAQSLRYTDESPIPVITDEVVSVNPLTKIKKTRPSAVYNVLPSTYIVKEGELVSFKFNVQNGNPKVTYTGSINVTGGTSSGFDISNVTVGSVITPISNLNSFTFSVDALGDAVINLKPHEDLIFQSERVINLTITVGSDTSKPAIDYPEFSYGSVVTESIKLLNPVNTEYSVESPIKVDVDTNNTIDLTFTSTNCETDRVITLTVKKDGMIVTGANVDSFHTNTSTPTQSIKYPISVGDFLDKNGSFEFIFGDDLGVSISKKTLVVGKYVKKNFNVATSGDIFGHIIPNQSASFILNTNYYDFPVYAAEQVPYLLEVSESGNSFSPIASYSSKFSVSSGAGYFTKTSKNVSVTTIGTLDKPYTIRLTLSDDNKGGGAQTLLYVDKTQENFTLSVKRAGSEVAEGSTIVSGDILTCTLTSSYGSAYASKTNSEKQVKVSVSNLVSSLYSLSNSTVYLDGSGVATFTVTIKNYIGNLDDSLFNIVTDCNGNTKNSVHLTLLKAAKKSVGTQFTNTGGVDLPSLSSTTTQTFKVKFTSTNVNPADIVNWYLKVVGGSGTIVEGLDGTSEIATSGSSVFADGQILSGSATLTSLATPKTFTLKSTAPNNLRIVAGVKHPLTNGEDTLNVNATTPSFGISKSGCDDKILDDGETVTYIIAALDNYVSRNISWVLSSVNNSVALNKLSSSNLTGSATLSVGGNTSVTFARNVISGLSTDHQLALTVTDNTTGTTKLATKTDQEITLKKLDISFVVKFYDATTKEEFQTVVNVTDSDKPKKIEIKIRASSATATSSLKYRISSDLVDLSTDVNGVRITSPITVEDSFDSSKFVTRTVYVQNNTSTPVSSSSLVAPIKVECISYKSTYNDTPSYVSGVGVLKLQNEQSFDDTPSYVPGVGVLKLQNAPSFVDTITLSNDVTNNASVQMKYNVVENYKVSSNISGTTTTYVLISPNDPYSLLTVVPSNFVVSSNYNTLTNVTPTNSNIVSKFGTSNVLYYSVPNFNNGFSVNLNTDSKNANDTFYIRIIQIKSDNTNIAFSNEIQSVVFKNGVKSYTLSNSINPVPKYSTGLVSINPNNFDRYVDNHSLKIINSNSLNLSTDVKIDVFYVNTSEVASTTNITSIDVSGNLTPAINFRGVASVNIKNISGKTGDFKISVSNGSTTGGISINTKGDSGFYINAEDTIQDKISSGSITTLGTMVDDYFLLKIWDNATSAAIGTGITYYDAFQNTLTVLPSGYVKLQNYKDVNGERRFDFYYKITAGYIVSTSKDIKFYTKDAGSTETKTVRKCSLGVSETGSYEISSDCDTLSTAVGTKQNDGSLKSIASVTVKSSNISNDGSILNLTFNVSSANITPCNVDGSLISNQPTIVSYTLPKGNSSKTFYFKNATPADKIILNEVMTLSVSGRASDASILSTKSTTTANFINVSVPYRSISFESNGSPITEVVEGEKFNVKVTDTYKTETSSKLIFNPNLISCSTASNNELITLRKDFIDSYIVPVVAVNDNVSNTTSSSAIFSVGDVSNSIIIKEAPASAATINITSLQTTDVYETSGEISFRVDTTYLDTGTIIPFGWTIGDNVVNLTSVLVNGTDYKNNTSPALTVGTVSGANKTYSTTIKLKFNANYSISKSADITVFVNGSSVKSNTSNSITIPVNVSPSSSGNKLTGSENVLNKDKPANFAPIIVFSDISAAEKKTLALGYKYEYHIPYTIGVLDIDARSAVGAKKYTGSVSLSVDVPSAGNVVSRGTATLDVTSFNGDFRQGVITLSKGFHGDFDIKLTATLDDGKTTTGSFKSDIGKPFSLDPVAQTFYVSPDDYPNGLFLSKTDIFFYSKPSDTNIPVWIELRKTVNGYPKSDSKLEFSRVELQNSSVNVPSSLVGVITPVPTTFTFSDPIYIPPGEYSIIIGSSSKEYKVFVGELGQIDVSNGKIISENNPDGSVGSFFMSQNARTWNADQLKDLMFRLYKCEFDTNTNQEIVLEMKPNNTNFETDIVHLNSPENVIPGTSSKYSVSLTGNFIDYHEVDNNKDVLLSSRTKPASAYKLKTVLSSTDNNVSPIIQKQKINTKFIHNLINPKMNLIKQETDPSDGDALSKYVTKKVTLSEGFDATGVRVILDVNRQYGTEIEVYVKLIQNEDYSNFKGKDYILLPLTGTKSYSRNNDDFIIDEYKLDNISYVYGDKTFESFKSFAVKVVMYSDNPAKVPRVRNLRAIATS
jgi:hypothetical protein